MTELTDRAILHDHLTASLARAGRTEGTIALLLVGLDRFRALNESLGVAVGDRVLAEVGRRLRTVVRSRDEVARVGGDSFAILCDPVESETAAAAIAARIIQTVARPFDGVPLALAPTASVGVRVVCGRTQEPHDIMRDAEAALHQAKRDGRGCSRVFSATRADRVEPIDLRERLDAGALVVHYQPVIAVQSGAIVAVEALARVQGTHGRLVPPIEFIADAERTGLIDHLGELVLGQACQDIASLRIDHPQLRLSVNVSPRQLANAQLIDVVAGALARANLDASALTLEITETATVGSAGGAAAVAHALAAMGVEIALDDFGTGASSLELIRMLPVHEVKIDRTFVAEVATNPLDVAVIATIIYLGRQVNARVVAEGVETIEQADALTRLGCDHLQGFLYSEPVPYDQIADVVRHGALSLRPASSGDTGVRRPKRSAQS